MRPLLFEPPTFQTPAETSTGCAHLLPVSKEFIQIWGSHRGGALSGEHGDGDGEMQAAVSNQYFGLEGAVIFSNKLAFHRPCYGRIR